MLLTTTKSFALGAKENEVKISLDLLDRTIKALRTSVVDDVHLCLRIADLLEGLTTSVRHKFVRLAGHSADGAAQPDNMVPLDSGRPPYPKIQTPEVLYAPPFTATNLSHDTDQKPAYVRTRPHPATNLPCATSASCLPPPAPTTSPQTIPSAPSPSHPLHQSSTSPPYLNPNSSTSTQPATSPTSPAPPTTGSRST